MTVGVTPKATSGNLDTTTQRSGGGPGSISSRLEEMELSGTDDDLSVRESDVDSMESDVERELLTSETDTANLVVAKQTKDRRGSKKPTRATRTAGPSCGR